MMEGALSLMQMAKICGALARLDRARLPYISVLTDPTTGGVTASFAMLGDLNIAEPKALIGFAGPRVIEQTIRQKLPEGFQRSEFLLEKGMLDLVVDRREMKAVIANALRFMGAVRKPAPRQPAPASDHDERAVAACRRCVGVLMPKPSRQPSLWTRSTISSASNSSGSSSVSTTSPRSSPARPSRARVPSVHIAGTNGKGSVTAMVDAALRAAGHRSARYTSPHLVDLTERFVIDGTAGRPSRRWSAAVADVRARRSRRCCADGALQAPADVLRSDDRRRRSSCFAAPASSRRASRSGSAAGSTRPTSFTPVRDGDHVDRLRSRALSRITLREIAAEKAGIIKPACRWSSATAEPATPSPRSSAGRAASAAPTSSRTAPPTTATGVHDRSARAPIRRRTPRSRSGCSTSLDARGIRRAAHGDRARAWRSRAGPGGWSSGAAGRPRAAARRRAQPGRRRRARVLPAERRRGGPRPLVFAAMRDKDVARHVRGAAARREPSHRDARVERALGRSGRCWRSRRAAVAPELPIAIVPIAARGARRRLAHVAADRRRRIDFPARRRACKETRRVVIPFEHTCPTCVRFFRPIVYSACSSRAGRRGAAHAQQAAVGRPCGRQHRNRRAASDARSQSTRSTGTSSATSRSIWQRHQDLRRRCRGLHRREPGDRHRQRRLRAGQQPHRRRARRVRHRRRGSARSTTRAASRRVKPPTPAGRAPGGIAPPPMTGPGNDVLFLRRDDREDRTEEIQDHQRRLHHLRAADAALGSARRHGDPERRSLHAADATRCCG